MALFQGTKPLDIAGTGHRVSTLFFVTAAGVVSSFGGAHVSSVVRTGVGTLLVTWSGFSPKAFVCGEILDIAPNARRVRFGRITITPETKTVTAVVYMHNPGGALLDASVFGRATIHWKMFLGDDWSGL